MLRAWLQAGRAGDFYLMLLGARRIGRFFQRGAEEHVGVDVSEKDGVRAMHLGSVTVQSSMRLAAPFELELAYTRGMMVFLLFNDVVRKVLVIGLGGASIPKFIHHHLPQMRVTAVEINPAVLAAARNQFYLPADDERLQIILGDGAAHVRENPGCSDVLMLDAYDGIGLAPDLCSQEFYDSCAESLSSDGILIVNLWGSDKNFDVYLQRIEQSFDGRVLMMPTGRPGNILVFGFKRQAGDLRWKTLRDRAKSLQEQLQIEFLEFVERLRDNNLNTSNRLIV
jgi:spermidine synthase